MYPELAKQPPSITLRNQPKLSEHEIDRTANELRTALVSKITEYISANERFAGQDVSITFSENGVSSLVSFIETPNEKLVLKIPLGIHQEKEAEFLKAWETQGVAVPHVIEAGTLSDRPYILMNYVDAKTLRENNTYEQMVGKGTFIDMGRTLQKMHLAKATGFGRIVEDVPQYAEFKDWLENGPYRERIAYAQKYGLLGNEHGSTEEAFEALLAHVGENTESSYCHNDFSAYNILDTEPMTVFDPSPSLNDGHIDLGRSIVIAVAHGKITEAAEQLKNGYFNGQPYDERALQASVLLNSYVKIAHWHKIGKTNMIQNLQTYLIQTKHLLEN